MAIVKMKKLQLYAIRSQVEDILSELQLLGCVELSELGVSPEEEESIGFLRRESGDYDRLFTDHTAVLRALDILKQYAPAKSKMLSRRPVLNASKFLEDYDFEEMLELTERLENFESRLRQISSEETQISTQIEAFKPWSGYDVPFDCSGTETAAVVLGTLPAAVTDIDIRGALKDKLPDAQFYAVSDTKDTRFISVICLRENTAALFEALHPLGFALSPIREADGTAADNIKALNKKLAELDDERKSILAELAKDAGKREQLQLCSDMLGTRVDRSSAAQKLLHTESVTILTGWLAAPEEKAMSEALSKYLCAWELEAPTKEERESVPVKLKNNALTKPLNMVTEMYSLPAYGGVDPNPLMTPFFVLFYGIMLADVGYGIALLIAGILVTAKARPRGTMGFMFKLMIACGISTTAMGLLTGGFFGDFLPQIMKILNPESTFVWFYTPLFTPLDNTIEILIGSMMLGFIHLITGTAVSFVAKIRNGNGADAFWDEATLWLTFAGAALAFFGIGSVNGIPVPLIVGGALFLFGSTRSAKGFGKITGMFGAIYNTVTGWFGDILSYSRLMALMLAGSVIAQVFNTIGAIPGNVVIFVLISLVGNTLNFGLNVLGCFVHDLRLQCLEFFGKFYEDGGRPFSPLAVNPKYYDTVNK